MTHDDDELERGRWVTLWALLIMFSLSAVVLVMLINTLK